MNNIYNCCCLCLKEDKNKGDNLIWKDSLTMCENCYKEYTSSDYRKSIMPINAIKLYRRKISELQQEIKDITNIQEGDNNYYE